MRLKYIILASVSPLVVIFDQLTKYLLTRRFFPGETVPIVEGLFNLTYVRNKGAAFGMFANAQSSFRGPFFVAVPVIALIIIVVVFKKIHDSDIRLATGLSLVVGGAAGNLIDRLLYGFVVDFLDFHWHYQYHFPAFNLADTTICIGVGLLMLDMIFEGVEEPTREPRQLGR